MWSGVKKVNDAAPLLSELHEGHGHLHVHVCLEANCRMQLAVHARPKYMAVHMQENQRITIGGTSVHHPPFRQPCARYKVKL